MDLTWYIQNSRQHVSRLNFILQKFTRFMSIYLIWMLSVQKSNIILGWYDCFLIFTRKHQPNHKDMHIKVKDCPYSMPGKYIRVMSNFDYIHFTTDLKINAAWLSSYSMCRHKSCPNISQSRKGNVALT